MSIDLAAANALRAKTRRSHTNAKQSKDAGQERRRAALKLARANDLVQRLSRERELV